VWRFELPIRAEAALVDLLGEVQAGIASAAAAISRARLCALWEGETPVSPDSDIGAICKRALDRLNDECESHEEVLLTQPLEGRKAARLSIGSIMSSQSDGKLYGL